MNSNIVAGSNVFLSRTDDPRQDPAFLAEIQDYSLLKDIAARKQVDHRIGKFSRAQEEILRTEMRCVYAKNDPCWGYSKSCNRVISACINGQCPKIKECNPNYTPEEAQYWSKTAEETRRYGRPDRLRRYYIVDMISDEEMSRYSTNLIDNDSLHPVPPNPVLPNEQDKLDKEQRFIIDPKTGKKMVVIGYRWVITDQASYENEELAPIWGFVENIEEKKEETAVRRKAKRIEKKQDNAPKKKKVKPVEKTQDPDYDRKDEFEQAVAEGVVDEIKLTDINPDVISDEDNIVVLLDNPAELAFVSGTFLVSGISHGLKMDMPVRLALIDDYPQFADRDQVLISSTALKAGCKESNVQAWKALAARRDITKLHVAEREFYKFAFGDQNYRWMCRNMYGVTHVCIDQADIIEIEELDDGIYPVSLVDDRDTYMILKKNGDLLGRLGRSFVDVIIALKSSEEIPGTPANINGISLQVKDGKAEFLGMGHLKFMEY